MLETWLTRNTVLTILKGIRKEQFELFKLNPEEFIIKVSNLINEQKATVIIEHITYNKLSENYDMENIFTEPTLKGKKYKLCVKAIETPEKIIYDHVIYDSGVEHDLAKELDIKEAVSVYVK